MSDLMWIRGENGVVLSMSIPVSPHVQGRIDRGDLERVRQDGGPWDGSQDEPEPQDDVPPDAPELPAKSANRAEWAKFAISQGMDRDEAAAMTKAELVARFTSAPEAP